MEIISLSDVSNFESKTIIAESTLHKKKLYVYTTLGKDGSASTMFVVVQNNEVISQNVFIRNAIITYNDLKL